MSLVFESLDMVPEGLGLLGMGSRVNFRLREENLEEVQFFFRTLFENRPKLFVFERVLLGSFGLAVLRYVVTLFVFGVLDIALR